jgi:dTDP-glucose pyrophosphorylase
LRDKINIERGQEQVAIIAVNDYYLKRKQLSVTLPGHDMTWLDTGSPSGTLKAARLAQVCALAPPKPYYALK